MTSLIQFRERHGPRGVAMFDGEGPARRVTGVETTLDLAGLALAGGSTLASLARRRVGDPIDLSEVELLCPVDHADPAHLWVTGTGLTHLGSAEGRDQMHRKAQADPAPTDSMKMFRMGVEGGKPTTGAAGAQPEWFYKGDGSMLAAPGGPITAPHFALDAGEEPELAGVYLVTEEGTPVRLGFALGNEFSDHVTERGNYLWLAHSKLRQAALGPELLLGDAPADLRGMSRILRDGEVLWEKPFLTGHDNMSHSLANLEHHHFKYRLFRRPGDVHVHFFGTATLSFSDGIKTEPGDIFEIEAAPFRLPVRNTVAIEDPQGVITREDTLVAPIRIAIVGLGKIARDQHVPVLRAHPAFEIACVVSRNAQLEGTPHFQTLEMLLASGLPFDAVALCQPPGVRFDAAMAAINAGKHVFLEKPPGATLGEVEALVTAATQAGVTLFASWHSRFAPGVETARRWLAGRRVTGVEIEWREDVRVWHPGQTWIWQAGGFGVFDPGINALSIATRILPAPFFLTSGVLCYPANQEAPVAADLQFRDSLGAPIRAQFDFLQTGPQTWDIRVQTDAGVLVLRKGGSELFIDGEPQPTPPEAEYRGLYDRFAELIAAGLGEVDRAPLRHVADAFLLSERRTVEPFVE